MKIHNLTIIFPPHNRATYLARVLDYVNHLECDIIIADSSVVPYQKYIANKHVQYLHFPNESFTSKMNKALAKVTNKYVVFWAEDDFILLESLLKCVEFLEQNPTYHSCQGLYSRFENQDGIVSYKYIYKNSARRDFTSEKSNERLIQFFSSYYPLFYAVHRSETMKGLFDYCNNENVVNMFAVEMMIAYSAISNGKHRVLPIYYSTREWIADSVGSHFDDFEVFTKEPKYKGQFESMVQYLAALPQSSETFVKDIIKLYFKQIPKNISFLKRYQRKLQSFFNDDLRKYNPSLNRTHEMLNSYITREQI